MGAQGQPVDMSRAAELAAAWLPQQPISGPAWAVRAMQWVCNTLAERLGRGELCPLSVAEQALLDPLEALVLRCYPDTLELIDENAHWLAVRPAPTCGARVETRPLTVLTLRLATRSSRPQALKAGLEAVQQPPIVHLPVLREQSRWVGRVLLHGSSLRTHIRTPAAAVDQHYADVVSRRTQTSHMGTGAGVSHQGDDVHAVVVHGDRVVVHAR